MEESLRDSTNNLREIVELSECKHVVLRLIILKSANNKLEK